jgi:hypothetical protein
MDGTHGGRIERGIKYSALQGRFGKSTSRRWQARVGITHQDSRNKGSEKGLKLGDEAPSRLDELPTFNVGYEAWYSESLTFLRQILPDRLTDFREHFEAPRNRKNITYANYAFRMH